MNPVATVYMANGSRIVIELLPEYAPNTVASFISCVQKGALNGHAIERIVPGKWVDFSYTAFRNEACHYLIPRESELHPELEALDSHPGCVCMGGYGEMGNAGCEPFFPLKDCPEHKGVYPVFGKVVEGMEELGRLEKVETTPVQTIYPGYVVDTPVEPQIIERVELELHGVEYPEPVKMEHDWIPDTWKEALK